MRWWVSAIWLAGACSASPSAPPAHAKPTQTCRILRATCDRRVDDAAVESLVERRCLGCHGAGGIAGHDFTSPAALRAAPIVEMVGSCQMPPDGEPALPEPDRRMLVDWSACTPTTSTPP